MSNFDCNFCTNSNSLQIQRVHQNNIHNFFLSRALFLCSQFALIRSIHLRNVRSDISSFSLSKLRIAYSLEGSNSFLFCVVATFDRISFSFYFTKFIHFRSFNQFEVASESRLKKCERNKERKMRFIFHFILCSIWRIFQCVFFSSFCLIFNISRSSTFLMSKKSSEK